MINNHRCLEYRFERKFVCDLDASQAALMVKTHPLLFRKPFPDRHVNNIYMDTLDQQQLRQTLDGISERQKIRIRWYGDLFGRFDRSMLEFKIKQGLLGTKKLFPLAPLRVEERFSFEDLRQTLKDSDLPAGVIAQLALNEPALMNRYRREYYESNDRRYRITVDADIEYWGLCNGRRRWQRSNEQPRTVIELKYDQEAANDADRVSHFLRVRLSRNSKYANGIGSIAARGRLDRLKCRDADLP